MRKNTSPYSYKILRSRLRLAAALSIHLPLTLTAGDQSAGKSTAVPPVEKKKETKEKSLLTFWDGRLIFDIEERMREESRENNRDFNRGIRDNNDGSWLINRFRIGLGVKPVSWLRLYGQGQDSREAYSPRPNIPGVAGAEGDDEIDLRQAYVLLG